MIVSYSPGNVNKGNLEHLIAQPSPASAVTIVKSLHAGIMSELDAINQKLEKIYL